MSMEVRQEVARSGVKYLPRATNEPIKAAIVWWIRLKMIMV
jgi:hypothetical protein